MLPEKKREILDMLVTLHNERSFLAAAAEKNDLKSISFTNRTIARDLLDVIYEMAYGELVDIKRERKRYAAGIVCEVITAEWA